jgi:transcription elongation GreA/GreB family factor
MGALEEGPRSHATKHEGLSQLVSEELARIEAVSDRIDELPRPLSRIATIHDSAESVVDFANTVSVTNDESRSQPLHTR